MILTPAELPRAERIAQLLLSKAVNDEHGRDELDPFYKVVTENRDGPTPKLRAGYSSCGDLCHWLLRCLGVREPWLNRNDDGDAQPWRMGANLNWLTPWPIGKCAIAKPKWQGSFTPGDVIVVTGSHALAVMAYDAERDRLTTAEYGQPGGKRKVRENTAASFRRAITSHIRLVDVLGLQLAEADLSPIADWTTGEELDALEGYVDYAP